MDFTIVVFDLETTSLDTTVAQIVEIAAVAYSNKLEEIPGGTFHSYIQPRWDDTVDPKSLEISGVTKDFLLDKPPEEVVFPLFTKYLKNLKAKGGPIAAGHNILRYDLPIVARYCQKYGNVTARGGEPNIFNKRFTLDTLHNCFAWFNHLPNLTSYSNDNLRLFLGATDDAYGAAHSALNDVRFTGDLLMRFLKLHRVAVQKLNVEFEGAFSR